MLEDCTPPPSSSFKACFKKKSVLHEEWHYMRLRSQPAWSSHALNNTQGPLSPKPTKQRQRTRWRGNTNNWIFSSVVHRAADCYGTHVRVVPAKTLHLIRKERRESARGTDSDRRERRSTSAMDVLTVMSPVSSAAGWVWSCTNTISSDVFPKFPS